MSFFLAARTSILLSLHSQSVYYGKSDNTGVITRQPHCRLTNFIEADEDEIDAGNEPEITLSIRKYPKRYFISWEVDEYLDLPYDPIDAEDAARCYIPPKIYLWTEPILTSRI